MTFGNWGGTATNPSPTNPVEWLDAFFALCSGCRVDAIAIHSYTCYWQYLNDHLNLYRKYNKPLWLTEFACEDSAERKHQAGQMEYMRESVPHLEAATDVYRYAWFGQGGVVAGMENDLLTNGTTNALGQLYYELAGNASSSSAALQSGGGVAGKAGGARAVGLSSMGAALCVVGAAVCGQGYLGR